MKNKIKNFIEKIIRESIEKAMLSVPYKIEQEIAHDLFAYVGIERLRRVIDEAEKRDEKYVALAEIYGQILRENLSKENKDIIHAYYELRQKLNQYAKSLQKVVESNEEAE